MDISQYKGEHIYRFPMPAQTPPMWFSLIGITGGDDSGELGPGETAIEYVFSGTGDLCVGDTDYHLCEGDVFILPEKTVYRIISDPADPWVRVALRLKGTAAAPFLQAFGLEKNVLHKNRKQLQALFEQMLSCAHSSSSVEDIMEQESMLLMKLLTNLCDSLLQDLPLCNDALKVKRFIENNYHRELNMDDIAACVFRSKDYVQKQFKQAYGITPYNYYMELKMECAKKLLRQTNLSIGQIAEKLGYKSDRYFSARFRRITGMTAGQFRKDRQA